jgi:glycosyltransferase involved in cell wall biosynthesis
MGSVRAGALTELSCSLPLWTVIFLQMKILTFNSHQAYVYLLAKAIGPLDIVEPLAQNGKRLRWLPRIRPLPEGCRLLAPGEAKDNLRRELYGLAICHNNQDLLDIKDYRLPKISVFHSTFTGRTMEEGHEADLGDFRRMVAKLLVYWGVKPIFVSSLKRRDWGIKGEVIKVPAPTDECFGYCGEIPRVLRVANHLKERDALLGYSIQEKILRGFPSDIVGLNPSLPSVEPASSWNDLKSMYRGYRVFLITNREGVEDGYNTATLEAMATGMPVISTKHSTSPVVDGYNGFISNDLSYLREKIKFLLRNRRAAISLGKYARRTVSQGFPFQAFIKGWQKAISTSRSAYNRQAEEEGVTI